MVRGAKRSRRDDGLTVQNAHHAVDLRCFQRFGQGQVGKDGRQSFRQCGTTGVWPESAFKIFVRASSSISRQSRFAGFSAADGVHANAGLLLRDA
jgi:hypothetical protein